MITFIGFGTGIGLGIGKGIEIVRKKCGLYLVFGLKHLEIYLS